MVEYSVQWVMPEFVRESVLGTCTCVWPLGRYAGCHDQCWERYVCMEIKVKWIFGQYVAFMLYSWEYALITSICLWLACAHPVGYYLYYSIPWWDRVRVHARHTAAKICERFVTLLQQWTPVTLPHTPHLSYSPMFHVFMCLYVFVCVQPAVLGGGGGQEYILYSVFTRTQIPYIYADIFMYYIVRSSHKDTEEFYRWDS